MQNEKRRKRPSSDAKKHPSVRESYHHGELVAALVKQGRLLLEESGIGELSLRETARRVGVSQTAPLHYFDSKAGLLAAIASVGFQELTDLRRKSSHKIPDLRARLREHIKEYVKFAIANPGLFQLMFGPTLDRSEHPDLARLALESYAVFASDVEQFVLNANWPKKYTALATATAWSVEHGLANLIISHQIPMPMAPISHTVMISIATDVLLNGLDLRFAALDKRK
ncbi:TetR/AcrR family transcriptional regulator [Afipia sp. DC4300-2b1]|uniref:TetR/AcrR family transcriptional regulator n=1 Tax=Afipia sp. DC4300-2b1 TaxID=2804672 RepID=UPI003CF1088C